MVKLAKGHSYQIDMTSNEFDAYLFLENAGKKLLAEDDDSGGELNAQILFTAPEDGTYRLIATSFAGAETGSFQLRIEETAKEQPKQNVHAISSGQYTIGTQLNDEDGSYGDDKGHARVFLVKLLKGHTYQIDMTSDEFDAYLFLENAGKKLLAEDDDSGGELNAQILFTAPDDGVYRVVATSFGGAATGYFTLRIEQK